MERCSEQKEKLTLTGHEISKIPDELPNHVLLPLLVKDRVVLPEHGLLVLLTEHHRGVLQPQQQPQGTNNPSKAIPTD